MGDSDTDHWPLYGLPLPQGFLADELEIVARDALAARHAIAEREMLALRAMRNATLPINRLPNEIFVEIIHMVRRGRVESRGPPGEPCYLSRFNWLPLMHVCRHWWTVTRSMPELWSAIDVHQNMDWLELCLSRSANAPLDLALHDSSGALQAIPILISASYRIRTIAFPELDEVDFPLVLSFFPRSFPKLEEMGVSCEDAANGAEPLIDMTPEFFPSLKSVTLYGLRVPWTSTVCSGLTYMYLAQCSIDGPPITLAAFLDVLEHCRALEELHLDEFLSSALLDMFPDIPNRVISLPSLRKIVLEEEVAYIRQLTSCIALPIDVKIHLEPLVELEPADYTFHQLFGDNRAHIAMFSSASEATIDIQAASMKLVARPPYRPPVLSIDSTCIDNDVQPTDFSSLFGRNLEAFAELFADSPITTLVLSGNTDYVTQAAWERLFAAFPTLETLKIKCAGQSVHRIFAALTTVPSTDSGAPVPVVCPNLRQVVMSGKALWRNEMDMVELERFLRVRAERGVPALESLVIRLGLGHEIGKDVVNMWAEAKTLFKTYMPGGRGVFEVSELEQLRRGFDDD
ncbi:hypothetical protein C8Q76DRAFT_72069 [Earliella scabrosa]|nr:hypothetical protein C8Q76DRAFT_72069 [Earliella scabrosa]